MPNSLLLRLTGSKCSDIASHPQSISQETAFHFSGTHINILLCPTCYDNVSLWPYKKHEDFSPCQAALASTVLPIWNQAFPLPHLLTCSPSGRMVVGCLISWSGENNTWWLGQMARTQRKIWQPSASSGKEQKEACRSGMKLPLQTIEEGSKIISCHHHHGGGR